MDVSIQTEDLPAPHPALHRPDLRARANLHDILPDRTPLYHLRSLPLLQIPLRCLLHKRTLGPRRWPRPIRALSSRARLPSGHRLAPRMHSEDNNNGGPTNPASTTAAAAATTTTTNPGTPSSSPPVGMLESPNNVGITTESAMASPTVVPAAGPPPPIGGPGMGAPTASVEQNMAFAQFRQRARGEGST